MSVYSRWWMKMETIYLLMFVSLALVQSVTSSDDVLNRNDPGKTHPAAKKYRLAQISVMYKHPKTNKDSKYEIEGKFGTGLYAKVSEIKGRLIYARSTIQNTIDHSGCQKYDNKFFPSTKWIALVKRGNCNFTDKARIATSVHNASAVVVFSDQVKKDNAIMNVGGTRSISVFITSEDGKRIVSLMNRGSALIMHIVPGEERVVNSSAENNISKTSVLFVSISFIVLMIISLAWLVFYYIQRFRYSHAKERLARRLACAAKKAIAKIPQNTVKSGDKVLEGDHDQCAVCIEQYKPHDVIRILPCTHVFHKSCVDPWLQENRSCPMCKMDILVAYGMQIGTSQESVHNNPDPAGATAQLVIEDAEASSSGEEAHAEVVLQHPFCRHFNVEREDRHGEEDGEDEEEDAQATSQLLGSSDEAVHSSSASLHSSSGGNNGSASISRAVKKDIEESNDKEVEALIENDFCAGAKSDLDEDDDDDDNEDEDCNNSDGDNHHDDDDDDDEEKKTMRVVGDSVVVVVSETEASGDNDLDKDSGACASSSMKDKKTKKDEKNKKRGEEEEDGSSVVSVRSGDGSNDRVEFHKEPSISYA